MIPGEYINVLSESFLHLPLWPIFRQSYPNFITVRTAYASETVSYTHLDVYKRQIMKALYDIGFDGIIRPDHGRAIWGEVSMPGYGLYDRALGACYLNGLWEAIVKQNGNVNQK